MSQKQGLHPFILDTAPAILIQDLDLAVKIYLCLQLLIIGGRVCKSLRKTRKSAAFVRFFSSVCQAQISLGPLALCIEAWKPPVLGFNALFPLDEKVRMYAREGLITRSSSSKVLPLVFLPLVYFLRKHLSLFRIYFIM